MRVLVYFNVRILFIILIIFFSNDSIYCISSNNNSIFQNGHRINSDTLFELEAFVPKLMCDSSLFLPKVMLQNDIVINNMELELLGYKFSIKNNAYLNVSMVFVFNDSVIKTVRNLSISKNYQTYFRDKVGQKEHLFKVTSSNIDFSKAIGVIVFRPEYNIVTLPISIMNNDFSDIVKSDCSIGECGKSMQLVTIDINGDLNEDVVFKFFNKLENCCDEPVFTKYAYYFYYGIYYKTGLIWHSQVGYEGF